ncbi:MAG: hypothetical protein ACN4GK_01040 [Acidimicrobiia bacterium]
MSEMLSAVAAALGAPEELIQRSADARAVADGLDAGQVLAAWAGGAPPPPPAAVPAPTTPAPGPEPVAAEEPADTGDEPVEQVAQPVAVATAVLEAPEPELPGIEPTPLRRRIALPAALGASAGAIFGLVTAGIGAVFLVDDAAVVERGEDFSAAVQTEILPIVIGVGLLGAVFGAFIGVLGRGGPAFFRPEMAVVGGSGIWFGAIVGLVLGAIGGGVLAGALGMETIDEAIVAIPVASALWWLLIGGALLGAETAVLSHVSAVPAGLSAGEYADSGDVRARLNNSVLVPIVALLVLVAVIAVIAALFLVFHEAASTLAIVISAGILLFAFLGGYRPSIKLRYTEVIAALAGIATVVIAIVMVVAVRGH